MPNKQPDARIIKSRNALMDAGMALLIQNPEASLSDIAQYAGVGRATLYRQFETRDELLVCIAKNCLQKFEEVTDPIESLATSALDAVRLMFELLLPLEAEMSFLMKFETMLPESEDIQHIWQEQQTEIQELLQACQQEKSIDPTLPIAWLESFLDGLFFAAWRWVSESGKCGKEASELAFRSFCQGVAVKSK